MSQPQPAEQLAPHRVRTVNVSINSANKIHDDETAARFGFRSGLVAGTLVYAHMSTPLVQHLGERWLDGSVSQLKLLAPAFDGEWLTVQASALADAPEGPGWHVTVSNEAQAELAVMETHLPAQLPPVDARATLPPAPPDTPVEPITWERVQLGRPLRALHWSPAAEAHTLWCEQAGDPLPIYREGARPRIQPGLVLQGANQVFSHHFQLAPWIHTASTIVHRGALHLGDAVEIRAVPIEKWERKGHQFVQLYVVFLNGGEPAVEVLHTAIFRLRPAGG